MLPLNKAKYLILLKAIISVGKNYVFAQKAVECCQCKTDVFFVNRGVCHSIFCAKVFFFSIGT